MDQQWVESLVGGSRVQVDRASSQLDEHLSQIRQSGIFTPVSQIADPFLSEYAHRQSFTTAGKVVAGRIQFSMPYFGCYRVALDDLGGTIVCSSSINTSASPLGPKMYYVIPHNTQVWVYLHPSGSWGNIIGVIPSIVDDGNNVFSDWVFQGSNVGVRRLAYYRDYIRKLGNAGGVRDFSNNSPMDQLSLDWGVMTEFGNGLHIDPFQVFLRIDETTGIFGYYLDPLLRVAGYNLDIWSCGHSEEFRNDEGEITSYRGESTYSWEAVGYYTPDSVGHRETDDVDVQHELPYGKIEPKEDDQTSIHRYEEYGGYLGQGKIRQMSVPVPAGNNTLHRLSGESQSRGVFREAVSLDGSYTLVTAKQLILAKRSLFPVPSRKKAQEDYGKDADRADNDNYKFAGKYGDSEDHYVGDISDTNEHAVLTPVAMILDLHAYAFNWKHSHAFHYHGGDFLYEDESADDFNLARAKIPDYSQLCGKMWLDPEDIGNEEQLYVDHRYRNTRYLSGTSHLTMDENGSLVQGAACGEEIKMVGGNLILSAPGNIILQSGKSTVVLAGDDFVARARNSVDISASDKDVRIKAKKNLHMLAANETTGSMLFESRYQGDQKSDYPISGGEDIEGAGIVFKAPGTVVATLAKEIYLRTGSKNGSIGNGDITLDAGQGSRDIRTVSNNFHRYLKGAAKDAFGLPVVQSISTHDQSGLRIEGSLNASGELNCNGGARFAGTVLTVSGHFQSPIGGPVGVLSNVYGERRRLEERTVIAIDQDRPVATQDYGTELERDKYGAGYIGNSDVLREVSFSFRDEKQCGTENFVLPQTLWQVFGDEAGSLDAWAEDEVAYQGASQQNTMPWPGIKKWRDEQTLLKIPAESLTLYNLASGHAKDRGKDYEEPAYGLLEKAVPQKNYGVVKC